MASDSSLLDEVPHDSSILEHAAPSSAPSSLPQTLGVELPSFILQNTGHFTANLNSDQLAQLQALLVSLQTMLAFQASTSISQPSLQATLASFVPNPPLHIPSTFPSLSFSSSLSGMELLTDRHLHYPKYKICSTKHLLRWLLPRQSIPGLGTSCSTIHFANNTLTPRFLVISPIWSLVLTMALLILKNILRDIFLRCTYTMSLIAPVVVYSLAL